MKPERIQLSRSKGFRLPENTVRVCRPGKWGNPFSINGYGRENALELYNQYLKLIVDIDSKRFNITELRGKNLACWCRLDEKCHADILLEMANK